MIEILNINLNSIGYYFLNSKALYIVKEMLLNKNIKSEKELYNIFKQMILCFEKKKTLNVIALEPSSTFKKTSAQSLLILDDSNYFWMSDNDMLKKKKEFIEFKLSYFMNLDSKLKLEEQFV